MRTEIILNLDLDIVCVCETHLIGNESISINGYSSYCNNRLVKKGKRKRGSGGVAILVSNKLLSNFVVSRLDCLCDGLIGIRLMSRNVNQSILVLSCYLPPEGSPWANTTLFFSNLTKQVYEMKEDDMIILAGDFNARIGGNEDFIGTLDNVNPRVIIDTRTNSYGDILLDFLKDCKLCICNGRITPESDNFTCSNSKGQSVVDYVITTQDNLTNCSKCVVYSVNYLIELFNLHCLLSTTCKPPDHAVISSKFHLKNRLVCS